MSDAPFDVAVAVVLLHEGGYVNDPADPGGETNMGIIASTLDTAIRRGIVSPDTTIRGLTFAQAKAIYHELYWKPIRADVLPYPVALSLFDTAVNFGVPAAVAMLQDALGVTVDMIVGQETLRACQKIPGAEVAERLLANRAARYCDNVALRPSLKKFRAGWLRRCFSIATAAARPTA